MWLVHRLNFYLSSSKVLQEHHTLAPLEIIQCVSRDGHPFDLCESKSTRQIILESAQREQLSISFYQTKSIASVSSKLQAFHNKPGKH
jgi:hypothetical protein